MPIVRAASTKIFFTKPPGRLFILVHHVRRPIGCLCRIAHVGHRRRETEPDETRPRCPHDEAHSVVAVLSASGEAALARDQTQAGPPTGGPSTRRPRVARARGATPCRDAALERDSRRFS